MVVFFLFAFQAWFPNFFNVWNFGGSWSLSVEAFFYSLFPALRTKFNSLDGKYLLWVIYGTPVVMAIILLGLTSSLSDQKDTSIIFYSVPFYRLPEFLLGIAGYCYFVERKYSIKPLLIIAPISASGGLLAMYTLGNLPGYIDYGAFFVLPFLFIFILCAKPFSLSERSTRFFNYLGNISYCVYIVQFGTVPLFKAALTSSGSEVKWLVFISMNLIFSILVYHFIEHPAHGYLRKKFSLIRRDRRFT